MRETCVALVFALGLASTLETPYRAEAQAQVSRAAIEAMLSGFEDVPSLAEWRALGPDAVPILIAIHDDPQALQPLRLRAVEAMGAFSGAPARAFLLRVMSDPDEGTIVVREAAEALAQSAGSDAVEPLVRLLRRGDRSVREGVILALGRVPGEGARHALSLWSEREPDAALREQITALLAR